jgi:hypothetical protein
MIVRVPVMPQNGVSVRIKFNYDAATAACFFRADLAIPVWFFFLVLFPAPGQLARADVKPVLGPESSSAPNPGSDKLN